MKKAFLLVVTIIILLIFLVVVFVVVPNYNDEKINRINLTINDLPTESPLKIASEGGSGIYQINYGDSFSEICYMFGVDEETTLEDNRHIFNKNDIWAGDRIFIRNASRNASEFGYLSETVTEPYFQIGKYYQLFTINKNWQIEFIDSKRGVLVKNNGEYLFFKSPENEVWEFSLENAKPKKYEKGIKSYSIIKMSNRYF